MARSARFRFLQFVHALMSRIPDGSSLLPHNDEGASLSPFLQALRHLRRIVTPTSSEAQTPHAARRRFSEEMRALRVGFPVGEVRDMEIPTPGAALAARLYRPDGEPACPVLLVYFHGGGFIFGDLDTHDDACRLLCQHSGMRVLAVAYRLAPEHPFPAAVTDAEAAVRWAFDNAKHLGAETVAVGGDSAGANLAAVTAQSLAGSALLAQLLIYPGTDLTAARPSHGLFGEGFFLGSNEREMFYRNYLADGRVDAADPRVSPLHSAPPSLAPAVVVTAGFDMLRDEGRAYADHLQSHGTAVQRLHFDRLGHGFINLAGIHSDSRAALIRIAQQWRDLCTQPFNQRIHP